jgi:hypothetical protein
VISPRRSTPRRCLARVHMGGPRSRRPQQRWVGRPPGSSTSPPARCLLKGSSRPNSSTPRAAAVRPVATAYPPICSALRPKPSCVFHCMSSLIVSALSSSACAVLPFPRDLLAVSLSDPHRTHRPPQRAFLCQSASMQTSKKAHYLWPAHSGHGSERGSEHGSEHMNTGSRGTQQAASG